ncbi:MAG: sulfite exporter TauE/SafE family protein [Dehalococcoidales bacterium]|nr:sulfite exporter TauE/SafE family protein [Dehalococcoidales bacterium]
MFYVILAVVAIISGAVASLAGFGIGSLLTPLLAVETGLGIAVTGVSIAHFFGTALRFFLLRKHINGKILLSFGLTSAARGLIGALLHNVFQNIVLTIVFGCLLIFAGTLGIIGISEKLKFKGAAVWIAGVVSGFFGGLVGNQGGIRSAAMLGFKLDKDQFVATATGIALIVDVVRMPVYLATQSAEIASIWQFILIGTIGVIIGTLGGEKILKKLPENIFKKTVSAILVSIGILILIQR